MDVTRSVNTLRRIVVAMKVVAWVVLVLFLAAAAGLAQKIAFIGAATETVESLLPVTAGGGAVLTLITGVVLWLFLLGLADLILVVIAMEDHLRQAVAAVAKPAEKKE